jgi:hypothetical protein
VHLVAAMLHGGFPAEEAGKMPAAITCASFGPQWDESSR